MLKHRTGSMVTGYGKGCFLGSRTTYLPRWQKILKAVVLSITVMVTGSADDSGRHFLWIFETFRDAV